MTTTAFVADTRVEAWLRSNDVAFTGPVAVRVSDIDNRSSRSNQARMEALVPEAVDNYRIAIKNGAELPAVVMYKRNNRYVVIDGNNRNDAAVREGCDRVNAYVLDPSTTSEMIVLLTSTANSTNGQPVPKQHRLAQAVHLLNCGYAPAVVQSKLMLTPGAISAFQKSRATAIRALTLGISETNWLKFNRSTQESLGRIRLDNVFVAMCESAISNGGGVGSVLAETVTLINRAGTEEEAMKIAKNWATEVNRANREQKAKGHTRTVQTPKLGLLSGLGKVSAFNPNDVNMQFSTDSDREILDDRTKSAITNLISVQLKLHDPRTVQDWVLEILSN